MELDGTSSDYSVPVNDHLFRRIFIHTISGPWSVRASWGLSTFSGFGQSRQQHPTEVSDVRQTRIHCSALLRHRWAALVSSLATHGAVEPRGVETHDNTPEIRLQMECLDKFRPSLLACMVLVIGCVWNLLLETNTHCSI